MQKEKLKLQKIEWTITLMKSGSEIWTKLVSVSLQAEISE